MSSQNFILFSIPNIKWKYWLRTLLNYCVLLDSLELSNKGPYFTCYKFSVVSKVRGRLWTDLSTLFHKLSPSLEYLHHHFKRSPRFFNLIDPRPNPTKLLGASKISQDIVANFLPSTLPPKKKPFFFKQRDDILCNIIRNFKNWVIVWWEVV